jgi:hypothetical protein
LVKEYDKEYSTKQKTAHSTLASSNRIHSHSSMQLSHPTHQHRCLSTITLTFIHNPTIAIIKDHLRHKTTT